MSRPHMRPRPLPRRRLLPTLGIPALAALAALAGVADGAAQDRFGTDVAVTQAGEVLVLKPGFGRGPASLSVFTRERAGVWTRRAELASEGTADRGESFGDAISLVNAGAIVASGDPGVRFGAYGFDRGSDGWAPAGSLALSAVEADGPGAVSLATVMAILQPAARTVASEGDRALVAIPAGAEDVRGVRVFERARDGGWSETGRLAPEEGSANDRFGAALALRRTTAVVGAPGHGPAGAAFVFELRDGSWVAVATLSAEGTSRFGASVSFGADGELYVGAPATAGNAGAVVRFTRTDDGWTEEERLAPAVEGPSQSFGTALSVSGRELWIGAPAAGDGLGRVDRFRLNAESRAWEAQDPIRPLGREGRLGFGASVAVLGPVAAVGAPLADGTAGLAAVFERDGPDWSGPRWIRGGGELERVAGAEVRCEEGEAAGFACDGVDLQAYMPVSAIGGGPGERVSDAWGWTDPQTGREYALIGRTGGAAIVDVTTPTAPAYLGVVPANPSGARDLKVYRDHLFFTGDGAGNHGLIVFDLTRIRDIASPPAILEPDARFDGIASAHNLVIDTGAGFAYTVGTSGDRETCGGGLLAIDIREPLSPSFAGCFTDTEGLIYPGRTHDAQCVIYEGPDEDYRGRELCFASNETALRIVDMTDKGRPAPISAAAYPGLAYVHQGWLSEDQRYFYLDDELDELVGTTDRTRTLVWDVTDLDDPVVVGELLGPNGSTDHNLYVKGDRMYQANYQAGFRVIDISEPENPREIGFFDTTPYGSDPPGFNGAWTAFPYFDSGTVVVTSMLEGVFVLEPRREELVP